MSFIKLYPLPEMEAMRDEDFGMGHPARCRALRRFGARELFLNVGRIVAFEECPLYLVSEADPNALVNGIRLRLADGSQWVVADDPEEGEPGFLELLARACGGEIVELGFSSHLRGLERQQLI